MWVCICPCVIVYIFLYIYIFTGYYGCRIRRLYVSEYMLEIAKVIVIKAFKLT